MSEMPSQVHINGPVGGQIAVGNNINQFQNLKGCRISITTPDLRPIWERHSLPASAGLRPPGLFLDRITEVEAVETSIQASLPVNLSGMAGIGKSTLLRQIAHRVQADRFPDGVFYLPAYDLKMEDLLQCLFSAFYTSNMPVKPDRAQLQEALREVRAIVVIDDLDLNPDETQVVLDITPNCMFVVASTHQVLRGGSKTLRLGGFAENDAVALFESELGRALDENERQIVCEINKMLAGHPESLRWLAGTVREDKLNLETVREKLKVMSVQGFFQESVQSLPERQKKILAILTTIGGLPLPREHLAALLPGEPIQPAVNDLAARNLIQVHDQAPQINASISIALDRMWGLAQWEQVVTRYFVDWLASSPARQSVEQVRDALWLLLKKAARRKDWSAVIRLGRAIEPLFIVSGYWQAWYEILQYLLEAARSLADRNLEGWALHQLGSRSLCLGAKEQASDLLNQAASIRRAIGDQEGLELTQHNLSLVKPLVPATGPADAALTVTTTSQPLVYGLAVLAAVVAAGLGFTALALFYTPRPPVTTSPPDAFIQISGQSPAFEWRRVLGGSTYQVQVDDQPDFSSPVYEETLSDTSHVPDLPLAQGVYYWHVRATSRSNRTGKWSPTQQFTISIPPGPTSPLEPANESVETRPDSLVFTWTEAENAAEYEIRIDDNPDFSSPEVDVTASERQYAAQSVLPQGIYSWQVRAINTFGTPGEWSRATMFAVSIPPLALSLLEPAKDSRLETTTTPVFTWQSADNASEYEIQVDDDADFSSPLYEGRLPDVTFPIPDPLPQGSYSWHVRAVNALGTAGEWSEVWAFTISIPPEPPSLLGPENGSLEETTPAPAFTWNGVENAAHYEIQVDNSQNFDSPDFESQPTDANATPPDALDHGSYYWRVRAVNPYDTPGDWSAVWNFTVSIPPEPPALVSPDNTAKIETSYNPTFTWRGVSNAEQYQIQVDDSSEFNSPVYDSTESNTGYTSPDGFAQGVYYWRVRGINNYQTPGSWSPDWQFIISVPPDTPSLVSPGAGGQNGFIVGPQVRFDWNTASNAAYYELQVDNSSSFDSPEYDRTATRTTQTVNNGLAQGELFWRVRAFNPYDTAGKWSPAVMFTLSIPPDPPTLVDPKPGSQVTTSVLSFDWNASNNAVNYLLQVDDSSDFSSPVHQDMTTDTGASANRQLPTGRYYWRVQAFNVYRTPGGWSQAGDFIIPLPAPRLVSPRNDTTMIAPPAFDWLEVANAGRYQIQLDDNRDFRSPAVNRTTTATHIIINDNLATGPFSCSGYNDFPYYWRVRALGPDGTPGLWSPRWLVVVRIIYVC